MRLNKAHPRFKELTAADIPANIPLMANTMRGWAGACNCSWQTLYREIRKGKIKVIRATKPWLISTAEMERYFREEAVYNPQSCKRKAPRKEVA